MNRNKNVTMSFLLSLTDEEYKDFIKAIELLRKHESATPKSTGEISA